MRSLLYALAVLSLPMRGAWIEMIPDNALVGISLSLPMRGAWIEITLCSFDLLFSSVSLPMRGAWIEIPDSNGNVNISGGRSPCGERGLK